METDGEGLEKGGCGMRIEETIKQFKEWESSGWGKSETPHAMALAMAISALEKQIPKEPILLKNMSVKRCPVCKCVAESDFEEYRYCQHCGQALKWGGAE